MMVDDDTRREIAKRLLGLVADEFDDGEFYDRGEVEDALGLVTDDGAWYEAAGVRRLAELIEPDACRDVSTVTGKFTCSRCRQSWRSTPGNGHVKFCPSCGAEVVE